ncbi:MAG: TerB family tellurite resistance protein [Planctomycetes bacterium]|nr:TerB family tellurite resistance protein [Planctomycetota bacterium]
MPDEDLEGSTLDLEELGSEDLDLDSEPLELGRAGWLVRLLELYFQLDDSDARAKRVAQIQAEANPEDTLEQVALALAQERLSQAQLTRSRDLLSPPIRAALEAAGVQEGPLLTVGLLTTQWDLLQEISDLYGNQGSVLERQLELLTITALGLERYKLARKLHKAHLAVSSGRSVKLSKLAAKVERRLAPRGKLPEAHRAHGVGIGLAYLEARVLARLASAYYERSVIEEEGLARLHSFSRSEKVELVEILIALAWADGEIVERERNMIEQQIALAHLKQSDARRLLRRLDPGPAGGPPSLDLHPIDPRARRFILEQGVLLSLVDDHRAPAEEALLSRICRDLGGSPAELEEVQIEVMAFYEDRRDSIQEFGPVSASRLASLRSTMGERAQHVIQENLRRVLQEVKETGELAKLLTAASVRELTPEEFTKVKAQLLDVCRTIPALALFMLPGGALLLPLLIKALPFSLLPSAFHPRPQVQPQPQVPRLPYSGESGEGTP